MSVNLDGYNIPRGSTLKSNLEKRLDKLEEDVVQLMAISTTRGKQDGYGLRQQQDGNVPKQQES